VKSGGTAPGKIGGDKSLSWAEGDPGSENGGNEKSTGGNINAKKKRENDKPSPR